MNFQTQSETMTIEMCLFKLRDLRKQIKNINNNIRYQIILTPHNESYVDKNKFSQTCQQQYQLLTTLINKYWMLKTVICGSNHTHTVLFEGKQITIAALLDIKRSLIVYENMANTMRAQLKYTGNYEKNQQTSNNLTPYQIIDPINLNQVCNNLTQTMQSQIDKINNIINLHNKQTMIKI